MLTFNTEKPPKGWCNSYDEKPTGLTGFNGAQITEMDTHAVFYYDEENDYWWPEPEPEPPDEEE